MPYRENRVVLHDEEADGLLIKYTIKQELRDRTMQLRQLLKSGLKGRRLLYLSRDVELNFGHPCGTLRDERGSVSRGGRSGLPRAWH